MGILNLDKLFGSGGRGLSPNDSSGKPTLRDILAALINMVGGVGAPDSTWWTTGIAVSSNTVTLSTAGRVLAVDATTASAVGPKAIQQQATPAAGNVQVVYDSAGIPTLNFQATDAVTECAVQQLGYSGDSFTVES